jgi:hypothetical protein
VATNYVEAYIYWVLGKIIVISYYYYSFSFFLSVDHELVHGRSQELLDRIVEIGQCWIFAVLWRPFSKWRPVEIVQCRESIRDIIIYPHQILMKSDNVEFMRYCPNWFLTSKNFYRSPFSKWPPQYRTNSTLFDFKGNF